MSPKVLRRRRRLPGLDGARGLAALSIVVYHTWLYGSPSGRAEELGYLSRFVLPHLPVGVTLFFTLSGFLLYRPIVFAILNEKPLPKLTAYLRNRALRIFPAYWVILLATGVVLPAVQLRVSSSELTIGRLTEDPLALLLNLLLMQNYAAGSSDSGIGPVWSLAVEVVFYLLLPFLGLAAAAIGRRLEARRGRTWATLAPPVLLFIVGLVSSASVSALGPSPAGGILARSFLYHADLFAFGMVLAVLMVNVEDGVWWLPRWWRAANAGVLAVLALSTAFLVDRGVLLAFQGAVPHETLTGLASAAMIALIVLPLSGSPTSSFARLLDRRMMVALGLISYSLFLWHEPLIRWASHLGMTARGAAGFWLNLAVLVAVSGALSTLTYSFVERPALVYKAGGRGDARRKPGKARIGAAEDRQRSAVASYRRPAMLERQEVWAQETQKEAHRHR